MKKYFELNIDWEKREVSLKSKSLNYCLQIHREALEDFLNNQAEKIDILEEALRRACQKLPMECPNLPEKVNMQREYGSDEPYYIEEGGCEFSDDPERCLDCQVQRLYDEAQGLLNSRRCKDE